MRFGVGFFFGNTTDWDRFEALERGEPVGEPEIPDSQVMSEQFALCDLAEPLGFDTLWAFEQHASPYLMIPDPHQFLSYFAGRTRHIDFGSMITVLPWHNPFRLAEQVAMLQHHLGPNRRYFMGVGRGLARRNFDALGIDMETARERFNEVLTILQLAFSQEIFSFEGEFFSYKNASVRPRPLDPSVVFDAWGTWTSERSMRNMAERGLHPMTTPNKTMESYVEDLELFNEIREQNGYGPAMRPIFQVPMYCCESEQEAREGVEEFFSDYIDSVLRQYELGTDRFANVKGYEDYAKGSDFGSGTVSDAKKTLTIKFIEDGIVGTPAQCAEKIVAHTELINPSEFVTLTAIGTMPPAAADRSLRLYAEKALPRVAHLRHTEPALAD
jgi:alkanesulfonate monooxygenase SsuD/methylene tetrahydromethanopterin reductase-like flavin-dependent oxidoreductase (luciferase family)